MYAALTLFLVVSDASIIFKRTPPQCSSGQTVACKDSFGTCWKDTEKSCWISEGILNMCSNAPYCPGDQAPAPSQPSSNQSPTPVSSQFTHQFRIPAVNPSPVANPPPVVNPPPVANPPPVVNPPPVANSPPVVNPPPVANPPPVVNPPPVANPPPVSQTPNPVSSSTICSSYANPEIRPNTGKLGKIVTPPMDKIQLRYYWFPGFYAGQCSGGQCWRCMQSPQTRYYPGMSTVESCSENATYNANDLKGDRINFMFQKSGTGPDGTQLYDVISYDGQITPYEFIPQTVLSNIMIVEFLPITGDPDILISEREKIKPLIIFQPCTGKIWTAGNDVSNLPYVSLMDIPPSTIGYGTGEFSFYARKDVDEQDPNFPF